MKLRIVLISSCLTFAGCSTASPEKTNVSTEKSYVAASINDAQDRILLLTESNRRRIDASPGTCVRYGVDDTSIDYRSPAGYKLCQFRQLPSTNPHLMGIAFPPEGTRIHFSVDFCGHVSDQQVMDFRYEVVNILADATSEEYEASGCEINSANQSLNARCTCNIGYTDIDLPGGSCGATDCQQKCYSR